MFSVIDKVSEIHTLSYQSYLKQGAPKHITVIKLFTRIWLLILLLEDRTN